jgi:hypothetical protein
MEGGERRSSGGVLAPEIQRNKGAAALPVAWQVQVGGVVSGGGGPGMGRLGMKNGGGGVDPKDDLWARRWTLPMPTVMKKVHQPTASDRGNIHAFV